VRKSEVTDDPSYSRVEEPQAELVANARTQSSAPGVGPVPAVSRVTPTRPIPKREEAAAEPAAAARPKQGFFGQLFTKLFAAGGQAPESSASKPTPTKPAEEAGAPTTRPAPADRKPQSAEDAAKRGAPKKDGESRSRGGRRRSKKKQTRSTDARGKPEGQKKTKRKPRKKTARKKVSSGQDAGAGKPSASDTDKEKGTQTAAAARDISKTTNDAPGTEQKPDGSGRKGRRRRSPYQTSGTKQRAEQAPDKGDRQAESGAAETGAKQPAAGSPDSAEKGRAAAGGEQLALPKSEPERSSGSLVEVVKDNKGIYTLKSGAPEQSKNKDEPKSSPPQSLDSAESTATKPAERA